MRRTVAWLMLVVAAIALGLGVAWIEATFAIPKFVVQIGLLVVLVAAVGFAGWTATGYYRGVGEEDDGS